MKGGSRTGSYKWSISPVCDICPHCGEPIGNRFFVRERGDDHSEHLACYQRARREAPATAAVQPVVRDRQAPVATLRGLLGDLGSKGRANATPSLGEYLATRANNDAGSGRNRNEDDARNDGRTEALPEPEASQEGAART